MSAVVFYHHGRSIGVEEASGLEAQDTLTVVVEEQRLGAAPAIIGAGVCAGGIHGAPVVSLVWGVGKITGEFIRCGVT